MPYIPGNKALDDPDLMLNEHRCAKYLLALPQRSKEATSDHVHYHQTENPTTDNITCSNKRVFTARG